MTIYPVPKPERKIKVRKPLQRNTQVLKVNRKRKGSSFPKRRDPAYLDWIHTLPCAIVGAPKWETGALYPRPTSWCYPAIGVDAAHVKTRATGGADRQNLVPLCRRHHEEQHRIGIPAFQKRWGINLAKIAAGLGLLYSEGG
jgi:hypothetical protein